MTDSKHTPGPWRVAGKSGTALLVVGTSTLVTSEREYERPVAYAAGGAYQKADAALIAAAPELVAMLREIVEHGDDFSVAKLNDFDSRARALLARVDGGGK